MLIGRQAAEIPITGDYWTGTEPKQNVGGGHRQLMVDIRHGILSVDNTTRTFQRISIKRRIYHFKENLNGCNAAGPENDQVFYHNWHSGQPSFLVCDQ